MNNIVPNVFEYNSDPWGEIKDNSFNLNDIVLRKENEANQIVNTIESNLIDNSIFVEAFRKKDDINYVVDVSPAIKEALRKGEVRFDKNGSQLVAQLRMKDGTFGQKLPIAEVSEAIDPTMIMIAIMIQQLDKKLDEIASLIGSIEQEVETIIEGQKSDRIALYFAGKNLFAESQLIMDEASRRLGYSQALGILAEASAKEVFEIKNDIDYLIHEKYNEIDKKYRIAEKEKRIKNINKCYDCIHKTYALRVYIYLELNEIPALVIVLGEFASFLKNVIVENSDLLSEYDKTDKKLKGGIWEQRKNLIEDINELKLTYNNSQKQLCLIKE